MSRSNKFVVQALLRQPFTPEIDNRPVATRMAEACITLNVTPEGVTRPGLRGLGFTEAEIVEHFEAACLRANGLFLVDIADDRTAEPEPPHLVAARMRVAIGELLPSRQFVVTQLMADGFTKLQIDAHLRGAIDQAGRDFSGIAVPPVMREVA